MTEEAIFAAALLKTDPAERAAYLDEVCAGDAALRARVEALLRSHEQAGNFLEPPAAAVGATGPVIAGPAAAAERPAPEHAGTMIAGRDFPSRERRA